jgi:hypothetical protein
VPPNPEKNNPNHKKPPHLYKGLTILPLSLSTCHCTSFVIIIFVLSLLATEIASGAGTAVRLELPVVS